MNTLLSQLNSDLGEMADRVRNSLVSVTAGGIGRGSGMVFAPIGWWLPMPTWSRERRVAGRLEN